MDAGEQFDRRVGRYTRAKLLGVDFGAWLDGVGDSEAAAIAADLRECGSRLEFREYFTRPDLPVRLHAGMFCKRFRFCQLCALRRSAKLCRAYVPKIVSAVRAGLVPYFVTFTCRNGESLLERYRHLDSGLRLLMKIGGRVRRGELRRWHPFGRIDSAVFSYEFKRGEGTRGGLWHPHAHGVLLVRGVLHDEEMADLVEAWCRVQGDADGRAQHIELLRSVGDSPECIVEGQLVEGLGGDLLEVFKYPLKFGAMVPADRWEAGQAMSRRRLIRSYGALRGLVVEEGLLDAPFDAGDLPYVVILLRFALGRCRYVFEGESGEVIEAGAVGGSAPDGGARVGLAGVNEFC